MKKSFVISAYARNQRTPGQVPSREAREILRLAEAPPSKLNAAMMLAHTEPRLTPQSIVKGLALDPAVEQSLVKFLGSTLDNAANELVVRKSLYDKFKSDRLDPVLRDIIFQRAMMYYRGRFQKSLVRVVHPKDILEKKNSEAWNKLEDFHSHSDDEENRAGSHDSKEWQMLEDFHAKTDDENYQDHRGTKVLKKPDAEDSKETRQLRGPFIGPKGGKYADPEHTQPWKGPEMAKGEIKRDNAARSLNARRKRADKERAQAMREEEKAKKSKTRAEIVQFYLDRKKALLDQYGPKTIEKAEARGGTYHKRITGPDGKHRYIYDPEKYAARPDAHLDGAEAQKKYITGQIHKRLESGEADVTAFKDLAKKHGADKVGDVLRAEHASGKIAFQNGKFSKPKPPEEKTEKSMRFVIGDK